MLSEDFVYKVLRHQHDDSEGDVEIHRSLMAGRSLVNTKSSPVFVWCLGLLLLKISFNNLNKIRLKT